MKSLSSLATLLTLAAAAALAATCSLSAATLEIFPPSIQLSGPQASQQLLAEATADGLQQDWNRQVAWASSNPSVAKVNADGLIQPVSDGSAVIKATANGLTAEAQVQVKGTQDPFVWGFRNHVVPLLTKKGCNSGPCHGASAGKNGFKLSFRGYAPEADYEALTRESTARRVSLADPSSSLFLLKPTMTIPHGGGKRFAVDSSEFQILSEWIAGGAPSPADEDASVIGLDVYPLTATLAPGAEQQLVVQANFSNGIVTDVTPWVRYSSTDAAVAEVSETGLVKMVGRGEVAITVLYSNRVLYSRLTVPHDNEISEGDFERLPRNNFIDGLVAGKLRKLNIAPSRLAIDSEFIRRAYLDAIGVLPSAEEVEEFLADDSGDSGNPNAKRVRLIDHLLEREEYVDYWAYKWSDLLLLSSNRDKLNRTALWDFYNWIRDSVAENKPWTEFANDIFTSSGSTRVNGALNYFVLHKDTIELAENTTQAFMGQTLMCARCHNHPLEKWTQKQYYQFANLFTRIGIKSGDVAGDSVIFKKAFGDINHPRLGRPLEPTPLEGEPMELDSPEDRKMRMARWLVGNPYFARNIVSRVWANFFGRGLVDPEDDLRATNPASNEKLFSALTADFVEHGHDVKHLIRTIMNSGVYQLSSTPNATNQHDDKYYSKYIVKRLPAEVILDAMSRVTGVPSSFKNYPAGTRAIQLPDVQVESQFLESFGRPPRLVCDTAERSSDPSIAQALHVINGTTLNDKLRSSRNNIGAFLKLGLSDTRILDHVFLSAFSRHPTDSENENILGRMHAARLETGPEEAKLTARREVVEDLMWALMTKKEFLFNH
jgi:hypothetical protein